MLQLGQTMSVPAEIIGKDDWLIYGKLPDGRLVFAVVETSRLWTEAPNWGRAGNCYGSPAWAEDWRYMLDWAREKPETFWWQVDDLSAPEVEGYIRERTQSVVGWPTEEG